jgi:phosphatidylserine decarboxylase
MTARTPGERAFVGLQYLLPQHLLSRLVGAIARSRIGLVRTALIRAFLSRYPVDLAEAAHATPESYPCFNDFFTRPLRAGARPLDPDPRAALCPVDGTVSQAGIVERGALMQAKGMEYSAEELLGGDAELATEFEGGAFATLYLAPHNYHRVHTPLAGTLRLVRFVPGDLFSVNVTAVASVPRLFTRNERVACVFDTNVGVMAVVMIGALFVGSITLAWSGAVRPRSRRNPTELPARDPFIALDRGALVGWFNMGSTVVAMFGPKGPALIDGLAPGRTVRFGERLAEMR